MENYKYLLQAINEKIREDESIKEYLRSELKKAHETIEKQQKEIKNLEGDVAFYKSATEGK